MAQRFNYSTGLNFSVVFGKSLNFSNGNLLRLLIILLSAILVFGCSEEKKEVIVKATDGYEKYYIEGIYLGIEGDFENAELSFENALKLNSAFTPSNGCLEIAKDAANGKVKANAAIALFRAIEAGNFHDNRKKIRELNVAISLDPSYAPSYNERGIAFFEMEKYAQSLSDRNQSIRLSPNFAPAYYNKAVTCEMLDKHTEAISAYELFIKHATTPELKIHIDYSKQRIEQLRVIMEENQQST